MSNRSLFIYNKFALTFLFAINAFTLFAQIDSLSKRSMLQDINQLESQLLKIHPGLNTFTSPQNITKLFDTLRAELPGKMARTDFVAYINPSIETIKCGHTSFIAEPIKKLFSNPAKKMKGLFPFKLKRIENKILITENYNSDTLNIKIGDELKEINGLDIHQVLETISILSGGSDGDNKTGKLFYTLKRFSKLYRMLFGEQKQFSLKLLDYKSGTSKEIIVDAVTAKEKKGTSKKNAPFELRQISGMDNTLILDINNFTSSKFDLFQINYRKKLKRTFKAINHSDCEYLIVDIRGNPGGVIENTTKLLQYIHPKSFPLIHEAKINRKFYKGKVRLPAKIYMWFLGRKEKGDDFIQLKKFTEKIYNPSKKYNFSGKVILLLDEGSFSASAAAALSIKSQDRGILIGTEAGGSFHFVNGGNYHFLKLKQSKLKIRIPTIHIEYAVDSTMQSIHHGILPDIEIAQKYQDETKGIDTQMEAAIKLVRQFENQ